MSMLLRRISINSLARAKRSQEKIVESLNATIKQIKDWIGDCAEISAEQTRYLDDLTRELDRL